MLIVRYTGRPTIAQSRIINYDGEYVIFGMIGTKMESVSWKQSMSMNLLKT